MLRGGRPIAAMAAAQQNVLKRAVRLPPSITAPCDTFKRHHSQVLSLLGRALIAEETFRPAFFRERSIAVALSCGIPMEKMCCVGGVQEVEVAQACVGVDGFGAVQMGRALLADVDWCVKQGVVQGEACGELRVCDRMNECIVGATMALQPLRCAKFDQLQW